MINSDLDLPESVNSETRLKKQTQQILKTDKKPVTDMHLSLSMVSSLGQNQPLVALYAVDSAP